MPEFAGRRQGYLNISVTKKMTTNWARNAYVPVGYTYRVRSSFVKFRQWMKNSMENGSDGRISRKKPNTHNNNDIHIQLFLFNMMNYILLITEPHRIRMRWNQSTFSTRRMHSTKNLWKFNKTRWTRSKTAQPTQTNTFLTIATC